MEFNWPLVGKLFLVIIMCIATIGMITSAYALEIPRIEQGAEVYLNDTVDISGVVGWDNLEGDSNFIQWCNGYDCYNYDNPFLVKLPPRARTPGSDSMYRFYIDPAIFADHTGEWYQYDELDPAKHGNTLAFIVLPSYRNYTRTLQNGTVLNLTAQSGGSTWDKEKQPILQEQPISNILLARGDTLVMNTGTPAKVWFFGTYTALYDQLTRGVNMTLNASVTKTFQPGSYFVAVEYPGRNLEYDLRYVDNQIQWRDGWNGVREQPIYGIQPKIAKDKFLQIASYTDDPIVVYKMEVQDPAITIEGFSEIPMSTTYARYEEYRTEPGMVSLFDVRGYTNAMPGTNVSIVLDESRRTPRDIKKYTFYADAVRQHEGNMSMYQVYVPIVWDDMTIGQHTLTVRNSLGAEMLHDFPISIMPADSYRPNATVKYALNRSPWVAPLVVTVVPTPIVIEKEKIVEKPVPPSPEVVLAQQRIAQQEQFNKLLVIVGIIVGAALLFAGCIWAYRIHRRTLEEKEWFKRQN